MQPDFFIPSQNWKGDFCMFGERLYMLRMEKNLTMKKAGAAIGVTDGAWNKYEKNKSQPSFEILLKIADFFDVSVDYLLGRTNVRDKSASESASKQQAFMKEFDNVAMTDPNKLMLLNDALIECIDNYKKGRIDEKAFSNLINLLIKTVRTFNKLVADKKENYVKDRWFPAYQESMLDFISGYGKIFDYLK
jgi:transcriptional regulator with XRE-family HTH domain